MLCRQVCYEKVVQALMALWSPNGHKEATPSNCGKLLLGIWYRPGIERSAQWHFGETQRYGKNPGDRDNPQPSPTSGDTHSWMQFRDLMSVGKLGCQQRNNKLWLSLHKIKSVRLETGSLRGIVAGPLPATRRVQWASEN
jgi:hypothetical protein